MTDQELIKKLKKDKSSGLSAVIDLYSGLLYKIAANVILPLGTNEDIEECLSDSFLGFYGEIDRLDLTRASIKTYLAVITKRKAIDTYRRLKNQQLNIQAAEHDLSEDDFTSDIDRRELVLSLVRSLGEPDATIITRKYFLGETSSEIAVKLGMSDSAVQKRLERSRQKLKNELGGVLNG